MRLAEEEMPGLMALREEYGGSRPLEGARIMGYLHMTVQTAVLIETLADLGAEVRWASCDVSSTQDHAAAAVVVGREGTPESPKGVPVFAWKGETSEESAWCTDQALRWPDGGAPSLILDYGAAVALLVHEGVEFERIGRVPDFDAENESEEWGVTLELLRRVQAEEPDRWTRTAQEIRGVSEETPTGVHRLREMMKGPE